MKETPEEARGYLSASVPPKTYAIVESRVKDALGAVSYPADLSRLGRPCGPFW
eukprot:SAG11_NODE_512_length_8839_cov_5.600572_9_plen_53_part_00